jgi:hypothetical protein
VAHSTWIALAIFSLFLVYITARGELPQYLATIIGPYPGPETGGSGTGGGSGGGATVASVTGTINQGLGVVTQAQGVARQVSNLDISASDFGFS